MKAGPPGWRFYQHMPFYSYFILYAAFVAVFMGVFAWLDAYFPKAERSTNMALFCAAIWPLLFLIIIGIKIARALQGSK